MLDDLIRKFLNFFTTNKSKIGEIEELRNQAKKFIEHVNINIKYLERQTEQAQNDIIKNKSTADDTRFFIEALGLQKEKIEIIKEWLMNDDIFWENKKASIKEFLKHKYFGEQR